jgi:hypothetical protein
LPPQSLWSVCAIGRAQLPMNLAALVMGGHVRTGLEDNHYLSRGVKATNPHSSSGWCAWAGRSVANRRPRLKRDRYWGLGDIGCGRSLNGVRATSAARTPTFTFAAGFNRRHAKITALRHRIAALPHPPLSLFTRSLSRRAPFVAPRSAGAGRAGR